jgi:hypothetical protein
MRSVLLCSPTVRNTFFEINMTTRRKVPKLTPEQIALHAGISKNAHLFSLDAAVRAMKAKEISVLIRDGEESCSTAQLREHIAFATNYVDNEAIMNTPFGRTRSLIETKSFLQELQDPKLTPRVPAAVREIARSLLRHYPSYAEIELAHKALPHLYGPVPPFSRAHGQTAITALGLDKIEDQNDRR